MVDTEMRPPDTAKYSLYPGRSEIQRNTEPKYRGRSQASFTAEEEAAWSPRAVGGAPCVSDGVRTSEKGHRADIKRAGRVDKKGTGPSDGCALARRAGPHCASSPNLRFHEHWQPRVRAVRRSGPAPGVRLKYSEIRSVSSTVQNTENTYSIYYLPSRMTAVPPEPRGISPRLGFLVASAASRHGLPLDVGFRARDCTAFLEVVGTRGARTNDKRTNEGP